MEGDRTCGDGMKILVLILLLWQPAIPTCKFILIPVTITAYNPVVEQTDSTPLIAASGKTVFSGMIALSKDLEQDFGFQFGDKIKLYQFGIFDLVLELCEIGTYQFEDRMHGRWRRRADILMLSKKRAKMFGKMEGYIMVEVKR